MKNTDRHTTEKTSFSTKATKVGRLFTMSPLLIAGRSTRKKKYGTAYVSFLFAGPVMWRWRKHALFP
ncbi:hypothetical protein [Sphingobacterium corticibacterium]|uniref:Uncharacterized protein n=1 Tax=Sphingobacterium corticibacterium TaxID=2484746 RepID=A0A4Q6XPN9_9SPHI|nr:hypothetical protein [Sphingobacterium corticibacterium]RZF62190.1 hypothetical protein EWE74_05120 [Sphingobacterium corticibacterium]